MLRSAKEILGYSIDAIDGKIGMSHDFYFNDRYWLICYLVVDTKKILPGRKVLIIPSSLGNPDWKTRSFPVELTQEHIKNAPGIDLDQPVSRQYEKHLHEYYQWTPYWVPGGPAHYIPQPSAARQSAVKKVKETNKTDREGDLHLRSLKEVKGYHVQAIDGDMGHINDFIIDDETWIIRYLVIDTGTWLPAKKVLIACDWIDTFDWTETKVLVNLTQKDIRNGPEFDPSAPVNRQYEEVLYDFYGRKKYWD